MALDLVNIVDLIDNPVQSVTSDRSNVQYTIFDTGDFDGSPTYYFEIVASNIDTSDRYVWLRDSLSNNVATITVPASTSAFTRYRSTSFTPTSGEETYHTRLDGTASLDQLKVSQARIIVKQVAATETRLYFPLVNHQHDYFSRATDPTYDIATTATWQQEAAAGSAYRIYLKDKSSLDALDGSTPWRYETTIKAQYSETVKSTLWNKTTNNQITATEVSTTSTSSVNLSVDFSDSATNFDDDDEIEVWNQGGATGVCYCHRAILSVKLASLAAAEVHTRVALGNTSETGVVAYVNQRMLAETDEYDSPTVYFEETGVASASEDILYLRDHSTNDSGSAGSSNVSNSGIDLDDSARARDRSSAITLTADNRYFAYHAAPASGAVSLRMALVIIQATSAAGTPTSDNQPVYLKGQSTSSDNQTVYLAGSLSTSDNQPVFLTGIESATDNQFVFLAGQDTSTSNQPVYLAGQDSSTDNQPAFLAGQDSSTDNQPVYVKGQDTSTDNQPVYLAGSETAVDNQEAFLTGQDTAVDNQPVFVKGQDTSTSNQPVFLTGTAGAVDNQSVYVKGQDTAIDNQTVYLKGEISVTSNQVAFMSGSSATVFPFTDDFTGDDDDPWDSTKWTTSIA